MEVIAFMNQKGGVGKTTSAVNIAGGLALIGRRVLLVDMDPQAHATQSLGIAADDEKQKSIFDVLDGTATAEAVIIDRDGLSVLPSSLTLANAELYFLGAPGREMMLSSALKDIRAGFDYIIIDCPPSLGVLTMNALAAATGVYIPIKTELLPMQGITQLIKTVDLIRQRVNPAVKITGVFGTFYDNRRTLNREVMAAVREIFGAAVFKTTIRDNVSLAEAPGSGKTIFEHAPGSHGAEDFSELCREIVSREDGE